jgi:uncharacterized protein (TIGR01777 family)
MKVVVAGGSGYIGRALCSALANEGHDVVVLSRGSGAVDVPGRTVRWNPGKPAEPWAGELAGAGAVVNLAGSTVGAWPWTKARQSDILNSRVGATSALVEAMAGLAPPDRPLAFVSASGVDYYGERGDEILDEGSAAGNGSLLARVSESWEAAARGAERLRIRVVLMRNGLILSRDARALQLMALPFRLFAGGRNGSGRQWVSWAHLADAVGLYRLAIEDATISGPVNVVAPEPVRNAQFAAEIGRALGRPHWLPAPGPMLRLVLQRQADMLLVGHRVMPRVAQAHGYSFRYPRVDDALKDSLGK